MKHPLSIQLHNSFQKWEVCLSTIAGYIEWFARGFAFYIKNWAGHMVLLVEKTTGNFPASTFIGPRDLKHVDLLHIWIIPGLFLSIDSLNSI